MPRYRAAAAGPACAEPRPAAFASPFFVQCHWPSEGLADGENAAARMRRQGPPSAADLAQRSSYLPGVCKPVVVGINGTVSGVGLCLALF